MQYGVMLLKKLSDFKVTFVEACKDTIYLMTTELGWITYTTYFYLNAESIVLLKVFSEGQGRRTKASVTVKMPVVRELRWKHVINEISGVDYDAVLDAEFGPTGTTKREVYEMRAVIVRPGLVNWNPISRTHTLEQMLTEIGEPVYRWTRKEAL